MKPAPPKTSPATAAVTSIGGSSILWNTLAGFELPMAYITFAMTIISLVWKSPIGLGWLPFGIGPALDQIFESRSDDSETVQRPPQYPRRSEHEFIWSCVYFCMYGLFGIWSQYGGIQLSKDQPLVRYVLLYSSFHMIMAIHHITWSTSRMVHEDAPYGKLQLGPYELKGIYSVTAITSLIMLLQAVRIICMAFISSSSSRGRRAVKGRLSSMNLFKIRRIKVVLDICSVWTLFSFIFFWIFNGIGYRSSMDIDRLLWGMTMYPLPFIAVIGFLA